MEGNLATTFRNRSAMAIVDLMDESEFQQNERNSSTKASSTAYPGLVEPQQQKRQIENSNNTSTSQCSPYDSLYWLGGDCMRSAAATSLSTIAECATMKTDNTTEVSLVSPATKEVLVANIVSPAQKSSYNNPESVLRSEQEELEHTFQNTNGSSSSGRVNANAEADIISQFHNKRSNRNAIFDDNADCLDYTDPNNSMLVDEFTDPANSILIDDLTDIDSNGLPDSSQDSRTDETSNNAMFCPKSTPENCFSASPVSTIAWCGGYPSLLDTSYRQDLPPRHEKSTKIQYPEYYAEFKPQRQYAFDEGDGEYIPVTPTTTRALMDGTSTVAETATTSDGDSLVTNQSSVQSFMVVNRPHLNKNSNSSPLARKLQRHNARRDRQRHLHTLIASSAGSVQPSVDSESEYNAPLDYALTETTMRKLQKHLPYGKRGESFWLQYSLLRDGASLDRLLDMVHEDTSNTSNNICSVLAIETVEGEVFGAFLTQTWRRSYNRWYGGGQSFLWTTISDEFPASGSKKKLHVFPYSFANSYVQLCDRDRLLVGGGDGGSNFERHSYGFGLALEKDLMTGSSCPCTTFQSPSLSKVHADGSTFEIRNVEVWTLTPCLSVIENPSAGLIRVHTRQTKKQLQRERRHAAKEDHIPPLMTIFSEDISDHNGDDNDDDDDSFEHFYNYSDCHDTEESDDRGDLEAYSTESSIFGGL